MTVGRLEQYWSGPFNIYFEVEVQWHTSTPNLSKYADAKVLFQISYSATDLCRTYDWHPVSVWSTEEKMNMAFYIIQAFYIQNSNVCKDWNSELQDSNWNRKPGPSEITGDMHLPEPGTYILTRLVRWPISWGIDPRSWGFPDKFLQAFGDRIDQNPRTCTNWGIMNPAIL
jgi:hypothetical protein